MPRWLGPECVSGERDLMIAATALSLGAGVLTANVQHFERVPGLRVESWPEVRI